MKRLLVPVLAVLFGVGLHAGLSLVEFTAELVAKAVDGEVSVLSVRVASTTLLDIRVNDLTEIRNGLDEITVDDLLPGMILKIDAFHTAEGFTARNIEVTDGAASVEIRGRVSSKTEGPDSLTVAGLTILANENTNILGFARPPQDLTFDDVNVDDFVAIEAFPDGADLVASTIRVGEPGERFARLAFEGSVETLDNESRRMTVSVDSVSTPLPVRWTEDTRFNGTPFVGAEVRVLGRLTADLTVVADKIMVQRLLHLAPARVKMKTNDSRTVQIILEDILAEDLAMTIGVSPESLGVEASPTEVVIPAGEVSGFFTVMSGDLVGDAEITAASGDLTASAQVEVRDGGQGPGPLALAWSPPSLVLKTGRSRTVLLRLNQTAAEDLTASLTMVSDTPELAAGFEAEVVIPQGQRHVQVTVTAGSSAGDGTLRAALSSGEEAELSVRVRK